MDSQKCREVLKQMLADQQGRSMWDIFKARADALSFALTVLDEWDIMKKDNENFKEATSTLMTDLHWHEETLKSRVSDLARMKEELDRRIDEKERLKAEMLLMREEMLKCPAERYREALEKIVALDKGYYGADIAKQALRLGE